MRLSRRMRIGLAQSSRAKGASQSSSRPCKLGVVGLCSSYSFFANDQTDASSRDQKAVLSFLLEASTPDGKLSSLASRFASYASAVFERDSYFLAGKKVKNVDVSEALKLVSVHWVCEELAGIELKRSVEGNVGHGEWTDEEMFKMLGELYESVIVIPLTLLLEATDT